MTDENLTKIVRAYEMSSLTQTHANVSLTTIRSMLKMIDDYGENDEEVEFRNNGDDDEQE